MSQCYIKCSMQYLYCLLYSHSCNIICQRQWKIAKQLGKAGISSAIKPGKPSNDSMPFPADGCLPQGLCRCVASPEDLKATLQLLLWLSTPAIQIPPPSACTPLPMVGSQGALSCWKCGMALSRISHDESTTKPAPQNPFSCSMNRHCRLDILMNCWPLQPTEGGRGQDSGHIVSLFWHQMYLIPIVPDTRSQGDRLYLAQLFLTPAVSDTNCHSI
jgi:hypothetical protein